MPQPLDIGDYNSSLFGALSGFWSRFFRDTKDLQAFYQASELYLGQVYLDLLSTVLGTAIVDVPIFNKEYWKLFIIGENDVSFVEGESIADDRWRYDMPGSTVLIEVLQNTIFAPEITFDRDVDFDLKDNDGYVYFKADPFRQFEDVDGTRLPLPGIAWRFATIEVGNRFTDLRRSVDWRDDTDVKKGDVLRLLGYKGEQLQTGTTGQFIYTGVLVFSDVAATFDTSNIGDIIHVQIDPVPPATYLGYYIIKSIINPTQVVVEEAYGTPLSSSAANLTWVNYKGLYFDYGTEDHEIDYINGVNLIGNKDDVYPLEYPTPYIYSVIRDVADPTVVGQNINNYPTPTELGHKHLIPGTVEVHALRNDGRAVREGFDYTVDYLRGIIYPIEYSPPPPPPPDKSIDDPDWDPVSYIHKCNYEWRREVLFGSGGYPTEQVEGQVRQISLWVPEVEVDRFTLYYNYGSLLNRFGASSETYRAFLRGIMYLYMSGPILYRINSALNVAAGYPVILTDGEVLTAYDSGVSGEGSDGTITGVVDNFSTPSYVFTEADVGGYIVFPDPGNDANKGSFRILELVDLNTVHLESEYGMVTETPVNWIVTQQNEHVVTTTTATGLIRVYRYPFVVTMLDTVIDPSNIGVLTFDAFDYLTTAFQVTDYIEDPRWWVNKYIPEILWPGEPSARRLATDALFENVIGPLDGAQIGDPGFFIGADDEGHVFAPHAQGTLDPVNLSRHNVAFILFDRYLKFHMFYIQIDPALGLDDQFITDLEELILVAKPSYTYPYVEPSNAFYDSAELWDDPLIMAIALVWAGAAGDHVQIPTSLAISPSEYYENSWHIGDPLSIGDYYRYVSYAGTDTGTTSPPGAPFVLPIGADQRVLALKLNATVDGGARPVVEGVDYTFDYDPTSVTKWTVTPIGTAVWDAVAPLTFDALCIELTNVSAGTPNTTIGFTPLGVGLANPGYVRETLIPIPGVTEQIDRALSIHIDPLYTY